MPALLDTDPGRATPIPSSSPDYGTTSRVNSSLPSNPLADITDEPKWMKKKRTLDYFRSMSKLENLFGDLSSIIGHWYKLEKLLGFQDLVSVPG